MTFNHFLVGGGSLLIWAYVKHRQDNANRPPLPPSPPRDPIIGHARYIPLVNQEAYFYELGQQYGGIVHLDVLGKSLVVLNKVQPAVDILEKRGALFSGRPFNPLADVMGISKMLVLMDYDEKWRTHRRLMQSYLVKEKVQSLQNRATWQNIAKTMVANLVSKTDKWQQSMMLFSTSVIIEYGYGHRIKDENDPYLKLAHNFCEHVVPLLRAPDGALVDIMPYARHLPAWLPGNSIVGEATVASQYVNDFANYPLKDTAKRMAEGIARSSFLVDHLEAHQSKTLNITIEEITSLSTMLFVGGAETTSTTLCVFLAAMVKFPEWQLKAQAEIDRVIGSDCLPNFLDRANLPMVECVMQETLRWQPAIPFGVPHQSTDDDIYEGMFIPKNSVIVPNIRGMALDHEVYQDPFTFNPSRFLPKPEGLGEPHFSAAFGFGRRVCVGKHLADDIVWVAIATMLASLSIKRPIGEDGKEYCPEIEFVYGPTCITKPFKCRIEPRNESMKAMIAEHTADL